MRWWGWLAAAGALLFAFSWLGDGTAVDGWIAVGLAVVAYLGRSSGTGLQCESCGEPVEVTHNHCPSCGMTFEGISQQEPPRRSPIAVVVVATFIAVILVFAAVVFVLIGNLTDTSKSFSSSSDDTTIPAPSSSGGWFGPKSFDEQIYDCYEERYPGQLWDDRRYEWAYAEYEWWYELSLERTLYSCYSDTSIRDGWGRYDYEQYVQSTLDDEMLQDMTKEFERISAENGFNDWQTIELIVSFVQGLEYTADDVTTPYDEWPRFPLETLYVHGGDCEDTSILLASLLHSMDYDAILLSPPEHMAVGLWIDERNGEGGVEYNDRFYAYIETTGEGWGIGELPDEYSGEQIQIYDFR